MTAPAIGAATESQSARTNALDRVLAVRIPLTWEIAAYVAIFAVAAGLRFFDLGTRALHHDESIHAQWSWKLIQGSYTHSPVFHGPFYYHFQGLIFFLFGANDYTARVSAAITGMGVVAIPLLLRRWLGPAGTIALMAFLALSPTVVYYSRFFREDVYMAFFVLAMAIFMWRYLWGGRERWLVLFALAFTGAVTTKEGSFLTVAVFLVYLDVLVAANLARQTLVNRDLDTPLRRFILTGAYAPWAWAIVALWPFMRPLKERFDWDDDLPRSADVLILLGTITLPLLTPLIREPLRWAGILEPQFPGRGGKLTDRLDWEFHLQFANSITRADRFVLAGLFSLTISAAAFVGLQWKPRLWLLTALACAAIYTTLMTFFWTNLEGLVSGPWGSLDYWAGQQDESRGEQPWFYYYLVMGVYEFLPLALCIAGVWWSVVKGNAFSRFLVTWLVGQWLFLSWGSEKMPWNNIHIAVPACVLAAWTVQRAWESWSPRADRSLVRPLLLFAIPPAVAFALIVLLPAGGPLWVVLRVALALSAGGLVWQGLRLTKPATSPAQDIPGNPDAAAHHGGRALGFALVLALIGALAFFSVRSMIGASFQRGDVPKDLLIYTQSSPDIPDLMAQIERLAELTGEGKAIKIAIDQQDSFAWPWEWYLRDYTGKLYPDFTTDQSVQGIARGEYRVALVSYANVGRLNEALSRSPEPYFGTPDRYPHRWWFDETYKQGMTFDGNSLCVTKSGNCGPFRPRTWQHIAGNIFDGSWPKTWYHFWRDRDPDKLAGATGERACNSCGSVDAYAFFPANFEPPSGKLVARTFEPPKPGVDSAGRPTFGAFGPLAGQFTEPIDIEADAAGNLYVIDRAAWRLQKFSPTGEFIAAAGVRFDPQDPNEFSDPWGLGVAPDGRLIVADTFGWTLRLFDTDLKQVLRFGVASGPEPNPDLNEVFGPRDAAFAPDGAIWVTDTGHGRIVVYRADGTPIRQVGAKGSGPGQFDEPVGISIASDGAVFVADMFNGRVVILDPSGAPAGSFKVDGWGGQGTDDKPYLRALRDGRVALSLPSQNQVRIYTRDGALAGTIAPSDEPLTKPYGMVEAADGKLWVVEGGRGRVRQFPLP
ncbi:MAG: flippase activity-associated protein Agl23 [Dehalococcoidia bacterium]